MDRYCSWTQHLCVSCHWHYEMTASVTVLLSQPVESGLHTLIKSPLGYFSLTKWYAWAYLYCK